MANPTDQVSKQDFEALKVVLMHLDRKLITLNSINKSIEAITPDSSLVNEIEETEKKTANWQTAIYQISSFIGEVERHIAPAPLSQPQPSQSVQSKQVQLPKLELPTFSGKYVEWSSFYDLFTASLDKNNCLSDAQKLNYLKAALKDEPARIIASLSITDANYAIAKQQLIKRYDNRRSVTNAHIQEFLAFSALKSENVSALRKLQSKTVEHLSALQSHKVDTSAYIYVYLILEKLDPETRRQWELQNPGPQLHDLDDVLQFIDQRARSLEASPHASIQPSSQAKQLQSNQNKNNHSNVYHSTTDNCLCCKSKNHKLFSCNSFREKTIDERFQVVKKNKLCGNCLRSGHFANQCNSTSTCKTCQGKHNTLLHRSAQAINHIGIRRPEETDTTLPTAQVAFKDRHGNVQYFRALLDQGSTASVMTRHCAHQLGLRCQKVTTNLQSEGETVSAQSNSVVTAEMLPRFSKSLTGVFIVLPRVTCNLPLANVNIGGWKHINNLDMADSSFHKPGRIDVLLGVDVYSALLKPGLIKLSDRICLQETDLGWIVSGATSSNSLQSKHVSMTTHNTEEIVNHLLMQEDTDQILKKFWELEEVPKSSRLTQEERECEDHFTKTTMRDDEGMYVVKLPVKDGAPSLAESYQQAERRFFLLEQRLLKDKQLKDKFEAFVNEFIDLGHLELVPAAEINKHCADVFYLPHHSVTKDSSTTSKLRVVFDASAKTSGGGPSLNDTLMTGPVIQDSLFNILSRFRVHQIALSADVAKMYRQICLARPDKDFHRMLWRNDPKKPIKTYRMTRVTYGIRSSAYHSTRSLTETALDVDDEITAQVIRNDFYVDDALTGADTVEEAVVLQDNLISTLKKGGFDLRKWSSKWSQSQDYRLHCKRHPKPTHSVTNSTQSRPLV